MQSNDDIILERSLRLVTEQPPPHDPDDLSATIRPFLVQNRIAPPDAIAYCERVLRDWKQLKPIIPDEKTCILDIGCGWGAHDVYLGTYYNVQCGKPFFHLIDGTRTIPKIHTGFREQSQPYRNGNIAVKLLNHARFLARLHPVPEITKDTEIPGLDLIVSFCAYGHHFPVTTYLSLIQRSLISGGHLLLDIRKGTTGREELEASGFSVQSIVKEKPKFTRILFRKW